MEILDWLDAQGSAEAHIARDEIAHLRVQRGELLEALEWIAENGPDDAWELRERARAAIALGAPATNPEAASAFAEMMGSPEFPSIKGEQK